MTNKDNEADPSKSRYGSWIVIIGFAVVVAVFIFAAEKWSDVKDLTAAVGSITGVVGTLAGAFFGVSGIGGQGESGCREAEGAG